MVHFLHIGHVPIVLLSLTCSVHVGLFLSVCDITHKKAHRKWGAMGGGLGVSNRCNGQLWYIVHTTTKKH